MPGRRVRLTENLPRVMRLRRQDVDSLIGHPGRPVEVAPTTVRGQYRLTARGVAGILSTPNVRFVIQPKVPRANLFLLLDPAATVPFDADRSCVQPGSEAIDFLAQRLAAGMIARAAAGLRQGYADRSDVQTFLQGRLDLPAQLRQVAAARDGFHVVRQEFTVNTPLNQLPRSTALAALACPFLSSTTQASLRAALAGYAGVSSEPLNPAAFDSLAFDSLTETDRPFIELCQTLGTALQPGGASTGPSFLIDLERVFERYVERGLRSLGLAGLVAQRSFCYHAPTPPGQPSLTGRPDLVVERDGHPRFVVDAKWKVLEADTPPPAADVHQAIAYAAGIGCRDVRLVYPGRRWTAWRYDLNKSDIRLTVHEVRVVGPREKCERSVERLARSLGAR